MPVESSNDTHRRPASIVVRGRVEQEKNMFAFLLSIPGEKDLQIGWSKICKEIYHDTHFNSLEGTVATVLW